MFHLKGLNTLANLLSKKKKIISNVDVKFVGFFFIVLKMHVTDAFRKFLVAMLINLILVTMYNDELLRESNHVAQNFVKNYDKRISNFLKPQYYK